MDQQQRQYFELRKKLVQLNYPSNFGVDSMDLVQRLFTDLISTTESYTQLQEKENRLSQDLSLTQAQIFPLRKENAKLMKDNHQLHADTVKLNEELAASELNFTTKIRSIEEQLKNAEYIISCKDDEISRAEKKWIKLREAYESVTAASLSSGGSKIKRNAKMTFSLSRNNNSGIIETKISEHPDTMGAESNIISLLRSQVETLENELKSTSNECKQLKAIISHREEQLLRMTRSKGASVVDGVGGESTQIENLLAADTANQRIIEQLNGQIDFLNEHVASREAQLSKLTHEVTQYRETKAESEYRLVLLEQARKDNSVLTAQLRALEQRVSEYSKKTDPDTPIVSVKKISHDDSSPAREGMRKTNDIQQTDMVMSNLLNERNNLQSEVTRLNQTLSNLEGDDSVLHSRLLRTEASRMKLREELDNCQSEFGKLQSQLKEYRTLCDVKESELKVLTDRYNNAQKKLENEMYENDQIRSKLLSVQSKCNLAEENVVRNENVIDGLKNELHNLRKEYNDISSSADEALITSKRYEKERQRMTAIIESLRVELSDLQQKYQSAFQERNYYEDAYNQQLDKSNYLSSQITALNEALDMRTSELTTLIEHSHKQQIHLQHQELLLNSNDVSSNTSMSTPHKFNNGMVKSPSTPGSVSSTSSQNTVMKENNNLQKKVRDLQQNYDRLLVEYDTLTRVSQSSELQKKSYAIQLETIQSEKSSLEQLLISRENDIMNLNNELEKMQRECDIASQKMKFHESSNSTQQQYDIQLQDQLKENQSVIINLQSEIRLLTLNLQDKSNEYNNVKNELLVSESMITQLQTKLTNHESKIVILNNQLNNTNISNNQFMNEINAYKSKLENMNNLLNNEINKYNNIYIEKENLLKKYNHMELLLSNYENNNKDNNNKLRDLYDQISDQNDKLESYERDINTFVKDIANKDQQIEELQDALQLLDSERDKIQNQLDGMSDSQVQYQSTLSKYTNKMNELENYNQQQEKKLNMINKEWNSEIKKNEVLMDKIRALKEDCVDMRRRLDARASEVGAASEDLMLMTRENQSLTNELAVTSDERDKLKKKISEMSDLTFSLQQSLRALEIERGDLLDTYRTCLQEKRKADSDLNAMSTMKLKFVQQIQDLQNKLADYNNELISKRNSDEQNMTERSALLLQIESLNNQLVDNSRKLDIKDSEINRNIQENHSLRQTIATLQQRSQTLLNRAANTSDANKILQGRISLLEKEIESLRVVVDEERKKTSDLSQVLTLSRSREALSKSTKSSDEKASERVSTSQSIIESARNASESSQLRDRLKQGIVNADAAKVPSTMNSNASAREQKQSNLMTTRTETRPAATVLEETMSSLSQEFVSTQNYTSSTKSDEKTIDKQSELLGLSDYSSDEDFD